MNRELQTRSRTMTEAVIQFVHSNTIDVRVGGSPKLLRNISVVGGTDDLQQGDPVLLSENNGQIYAHSMAARSGSRRVVSGGSGGGSGLAPHSMSYHTDEDSWHAGLTGDDLHDPKDHASSHESDGGDEVDHDSLSGFVENEHIDWTEDQGGTNILTANLVTTADAASNPSTLLLPDGNGDITLADLTATIVDAQDLAFHQIGGDEPSPTFAGMLWLDTS